MQKLYLVIKKNKTKCNKKSSNIVTVSPKFLFPGSGLLKLFNKMKVQAMLDEIGTDFDLVFNYLPINTTRFIIDMDRTIRKSNKDAEIVVVVGYLAEKVKADLSDEIIENYLVKDTDYPYVLVDSSCVKPGVYNVVVRDSQLLVMSNKLENFNVKYCCMTKLDAVSARLLKQEIDSMINNDMYDQFFEDSLVQLIIFHDFQLYCENIAGKGWSEVDTVDDFLNAQKIHHEKRNNKLRNE